MGEFRRQPSKVWWSDADDSKMSGFLGWGTGVDLSGTFGEDVKSNLAKSSEDVLSINTLNASVTKNPLKRVPEYEEQDPQAGEVLNWEPSKIETTWENPDLTGNRGSSSSPSQGSHKSQDSGFSDSEIHPHGLSSSPQDSPDLSKRLCEENLAQKQDSTCGSSTNQDRINVNETVVKYQKVKTAVKKFSYHVVEFQEDCCNAKFLETAFDAEEEKTSTKDQCDSSKTLNVIASPKQSKRRNLIKTHISRAKNDNHEKINQIQNQLELSFKLPKKINVPQSPKISNLIITQFQARPHDDRTQIARTNEKVTLNVSRRTSSEDLTSASTTSLISASSFSSEYTVIEKPKSSSRLDDEGFKIPKKLNEQSVSCKGSINFLDITDIEGPPISSSTPKSSKVNRQESPTPKTARATEKTVASTSTFATIRKLKGLSEKKIKGPINLLTSFNRCNSFSKKAKSRIDTKASVNQWMTELGGLYEAEIMTTLQSKSLATDLTRQVTNMAATTSETVRKLHQRTKTISSEFSKLCQHMKCKKYKQIGPLVQSLIGHINEFITDYVQNQDLEPQTDEQNQSSSQRTEETTLTPQEQTCQEMITDFRQAEPETKEVTQKEPVKTKEQEVLDACQKLRDLTMEKYFDHDLVDEQVTQLGRRFTEVVDVLLISHIRALVNVLEEPRTELALRTALSALTTLGLEGNHLSHLVARCGGVRALLAICLEARASAVRVSALRALATTCCIAETIRQFEQAGGVEIVSDFLADESRSEAELSEAAAVLAQITAPWVEDNHSVNGLGHFLSSLVTSLTRIVKEYKSSETLLLSAAALANLTFMEPRTVWPLLDNQTAGILLAAVRRQGPKVSVFIQEQAATVIANMASVPECRKHLAEHRAVVALLCFLQIRHSPLQRAPEITAAERVQQKSAIALSRLCSDATVARQVIELQGVHRLVRLCKEERERNHSDGVLVACLAALRKIVANCGTEAMEQLNAMELVEPRLLDSFLLYSSRQESYV